MIKVKPRYIVEVYPKEKWFPEDYGQGKRYKKVYDNANSLMRKILDLKQKGELEDVDFVIVQNKETYRTPDGRGFDDIYQALAHLFEYDERYVYSYKGLLNDTTISTATSFRELVEAAYYDPVDFKIISSEPPLSNEQQEFLKKVIQLGLEERAMRKLAE